MNARKWMSGLTALSLALSSGAFAQTFSQEAPVPDRAHDGNRGETAPRVTRGDIREQEQRERRYEQQQHRDQGRDRRGDRNLQRERELQQQQQQQARQQRDWERQRDHQRRGDDWRRAEPNRPDYRGRDMRYERGAGPNHNWYRGSRLPPEYRGRQYIVEDWRGHRLSAPPRGYHWVQSGSDYLLVAIATGVIAQLLINSN